MDFCTIAKQLGMRVTYLESTDSTNSQARGKDCHHGDIIVAGSQSSGRGQRGNSWSSAPGMNLTFSMVAEPRFLASEKQFLLSETVALAVADLLRQYGILARVKWPNDIYVGDKKICGILIENDVIGTVLSRSIIGVGLNVNQTEFDPCLPNPVSMKGLTGCAYRLKDVLLSFCRHFNDRYRALSEADSADISTAYNENLYRRDIPALYSYPDGITFHGIIRRVRKSGELIIEKDDGTTESFLFREVEFVI